MYEIWVGGSVDVGGEEMTRWFRIDYVGKMDVVVMGVIANVMGYPWSFFAEFDDYTCKYCAEKLVRIIDNIKNYSTATKENKEKAILFCEKFLKICKRFPNCHVDIER